MDNSKDIERAYTYTCSYLFVPLSSLAALLKNVQIQPIKGLSVSVYRIECGRRNVSVFVVKTRITRTDTDGRFESYYPLVIFTWDQGVSMVELSRSYIFRTTCLLLLPKLVRQIYRN